MTSKPRAIIHLNVADFAASVERLAQPGLRGRPLIVAPLGAARALVHDMSEEAFASGVRKGMGLERARRLCRDARVVSPDPPRYQRAMAELLRQAQPFSPLIEAEEHSGHLFLDLSGTGGLWGPPQDVGRRLRRDCLRGLGLDPIWTLAPNKLLAKAASRLVKPRGEYIVPPGQESQFLAPLPLHLLPGLERPDLMVLRQLNLERVGQAAPWSPEQWEVLFGRRGHHLQRLLSGLDDSPVRPAGQEPPALRLEHMFSPDTNQVPVVEAALWGLVEKAGRALRRQGRVTRRLLVILHYSDGQRAARQRGQRPGSALDQALFALALQALRAAWQRRVRLRHLALHCQELALPPAQLELDFGPAANPDPARQAEPSRQAEPARQADPAKEAQLLAALDQIRQRHGEDSLRLGRGLGV